MSDEEDIAALVVDNGSGMCKGEQRLKFADFVDVVWRQIADDDNDVMIHLR